MAQDSQSQKAGEGALQIQAGGNVNITLQIPFAQITDFIREEMARIGGKIWSMAQDMLQAARIQPGPVPIKTLVPLLQYASLEEDDYLQERWAALLANAALEGPVHPSFPQVLSRLSSADAKFLDALYEEDQKDGPLRIALHGHAADQLGFLYGNLGLTSTRWCTTEGDYEEFGKEVVEAQKTQFNSTLDNLVSLGLLASERTAEVEEYPPSWNTIGLTHRTTLHLTTLGFEFVKVCRAPMKGEDE